MIDVEILESMKAEGFDLPPGTMGENLTLAGVRVQECALGDRLRFPSGLEIEITKVRTPCFVLDSISPELKRIMWNRSGMYAKVLLEGTVSPGDTIELDSCGDEPRPALRDVPENAIDGAALLPWA